MQNTFEGGFELEDEVFEHETRENGKIKTQFFVGGQKDGGDKLGKVRAILGKVQKNEDNERNINYVKLVNDNSASILFFDLDFADDSTPNKKTLDGSWAPMHIMMSEELGRRGR